MVYKRHSNLKFESKRHSKFNFQIADSSQPERLPLSNAPSLALPRPGVAVVGDPQEGDGAQLG